MSVEDGYGKPRVATNEKFSIPLKDADPAGVVKRETLEYFLLNPGWHRPAELEKDPAVGSSITPELNVDSRAIQMRLLRYVRQGLLDRRTCAQGRSLVYRITFRGENRLFYLWEKFGLIEVSKSIMPREEVERMIELVEIKQSRQRTYRHSLLLRDKS